MMWRFWIIAISLLLALSCQERGAVGGGEELSIAHLKSLCSGDHHHIVGDYRLRGVVVAGGWYGEFPGCIVVADDSGGVELYVESAELGAAELLNTEVEIHCSGLMLARIGGKVALGAPSTDDFPLASIGGEELSQYIHLTGRKTHYQPKNKRFTDITADDISSPFLFEEVRICDEERGLKWCDNVDDEAVTTYRTLLDAEGNRLDVCTLPTCHYALEDIPLNEISVVGVIDYSHNRYFIRIANKAISSTQ